MNPFDVFLIRPILNILILFYTILSSIGIPGALGLAIILMTVVIRMALWPLTATQLKSTKKMAALKPHLDRIKEEHGQDKTRHQQEVSKLYKEHGVNPLAGCLPLLLQIPVFISLYQVLLKVVDVNNGSFLTDINNQLYTPYFGLMIRYLPSPSPSETVVTLEWLVKAVWIILRSEGLRLYKNSSLLVSITFWA